MVKLSWDVLANTKGQRQNLSRICAKNVNRRVALPCCNIRNKKRAKCKKLIPNIEKASLKWRIMYASMNPRDRHQYIFESIRNWLGDDGGHQVKWRFVHPATSETYPVCRKAFSHLTGIGQFLLVTCENQIKSGYSSWIGRRGNSENCEIVAPYYRAWIEWQIRHSAEHQPDATYVNFRCGSRIGFFYQFENDWKALGTVLLPAGYQPSSRTFYRVLAEKIFKGRIGWHRFIRFNKCEVCACIGAKIAQSKLNEERNELRRIWHVHNTWQMFEVRFSKI